MFRSSTASAPKERRFALATLIAVPLKLASLIAGDRETPPNGYYHGHRKARR